MNLHRKFGVLCLRFLLCLPSLVVAQPSPLNMLFIGNSFTNDGPIPDLVRDIAVTAGFPAPNVTSVARTGRDLDFHTRNGGTLRAIDQGGWGVVVLQEFSTKPTEVGNPLEFKVDATTLYDRVKATSPDAEIIMFETWARREDHSIYDDSFLIATFGIDSGREEMQAQLNYHYHDVAENYIPANSANQSGDVWVAPVGEAWHAEWNDQNIGLHASDGYHGSIFGQYLNALVIYSTIYDSPVSLKDAIGNPIIGLPPPLAVPEGEAAYLQAISDATTGAVSGSSCGDGICVFGEDENNCAIDCTTLGNPPVVAIDNPAGPVSGTNVAIEISATDVEDSVGTLTVEWNVDGGAWQTTIYDAITGLYTAIWDSTSVADGSHSINARGIDSDSNVSTSRNGVTVDNFLSADMHVGDLDSSTLAGQGGRWGATVTITVHDDADNPLNNATVSGSWSAGTNGSGSSMTNASGECSITRNNINRNSDSVTFTVSDLTHATNSYMQADNHDPDSDSDGTSIVVLKP